MKSILATAAILGGLAIMAAGSANAATPYECEQYAQNVAEQQYPTGGGAITGGVFGGLIGAGIAGATGGSVGTGAGVGAGLGLVVGSAAWQNKKKQAHDLAYSQCIGSGTPVYAPGPPVYTPPAGVVAVGTPNAYVSGATVVNIRPTASTQYNPIGQVYANQQISVSSCNLGWCGIYVSNGGLGYISQMYVYPL